MVFAHDQLLLILYVRFSVGEEQLTSRQAVLTRLFCPRLNYLQMVTLTLLVSTDPVHHHIASQEPLLTELFATFNKFTLCIA